MKISRKNVYNILLWSGLIILASICYSLAVSNINQYDHHTSQLETRIAEQDAMIAELMEQLDATKLIPTQSVKVRATAYYAGYPYDKYTTSGHGLIPRGLIEISGVKIFTISADPRFIPLGSVIFIQGLGIGLVHDTGSAIVGKKIDICLESADAAMQFGSRLIEIFVMKTK